MRVNQSHLVESRHISSVRLNAAIDCIEFFFEVTLSQVELWRRCKRCGYRGPSPVALSRDQASAIYRGGTQPEGVDSTVGGISAPAYGPSEVVALEGLTDIDSKRNDAGRV